MQPTKIERGEYGSVEGEPMEGLHPYLPLRC